MKFDSGNAPQTNEYQQETLIPEADRVHKVMCALMHANSRVVMPHADMYHDEALREAYSKVNEGVNILIDYWTSLVNEIYHLEDEEEWRPHDIKHSKDK